uniref:DUF7054 domain-containing protein n=1 Tax=Kalanchoe fedtschenkoi TaxID=63787 RepID=A0A7N0TLJ1_KALFE
MAMEATVGDLIASAVRQYVKEGRRPALPTTDPAGFDLHYSQFCLECLNREEKLVKVWSRNFLLCPKKDAAEGSGSVGVRSLGSTCSEQAELGVKSSSPWDRFMDFLR